MPICVGGGADATGFAIAFVALALGVVASMARADVTVTSVVPYDMTMLEVKGSAEAGEVTLTAGEKSASVTLAAAGNYTLAVEGLTPGSVCAYTVSQGTSSVGGSVVMAGQTDTKFGATTTERTNGTWVNEPDKKGDKFTFAGTASTFEIDGATLDKVVYVDSAVKFTEGADEPLPIDDSSLGAFTLAQTDDENPDELYWAGYTASGWVKLVGVSAATGEYVSRMEFDLTTDGVRKVRYSIKSETGAFVVLKDADGIEWFEAPSGTAATVGSVSYEGTGELGSLAGSTIDAEHLARVGSTDYATLQEALSAAGTSEGSVTLLTNVRANPDTAPHAGTWTMEGGYDVNTASVGAYTSTYANQYQSLTVALANNAVVMTSTAINRNVVVSGDFKGKMGEKGLDDAGANSCTYLESYVLGLDATDSTATTYIAAVNDDDADYLTLTMPKVKQRSESETGVEVSYTVQTSSDPSFSSYETGKPTKENSFKASLPTEGGKVRYYRVQINMK